MTRELKGYHVLIIAVCAFSVIIAANLTMLFAATGSFPGLVVKNSYVAGVGWNERAAEQQALGWTQEVTYRGGTVEIALTDASGNPVAPGEMQITIGRPATQALDQVFQVSGVPPYRIEIPLDPGQWRIEMHATGDQSYQTSASLLIPDRR